MAISLIVCLLEDDFLPEFLYLAKLVTEQVRQIELLSVIASIDLFGGQSIHSILE